MSQIGPQEVAIEQPFQDCGKYKESRPNANTLIVGESHVKTVTNSEAESKFKDELQNIKDEGGIVIVEMDCNSPANFYAAASPHPSFMTEAQQFAEKEGLQLHMLETKRGNEYSDYVKEGAGEVISAEDMEWIHGVQHGILMTPQDLANEVIALSQKGDEVSLNRLRAIQLAKSIEHNPSASEIVRMLLSDTITLDGIIKDRRYQREAALLLKANPGKKALIIVGERHREGIALTAQSPDYVTPIPDTLLQQIKTNLEALKNLSKPIVRFGRWA